MLNKQISPDSGPGTDAYFAAALSLHKYLVARHWNGRALLGPDPGVRLNYRIGRFVKSYVPRQSWNDDLFYLQAQGYWALANWQLFARTGLKAYRDIAINGARHIVARQRADGAWDYPNPEWKGRVATVEGIWASIGLLEASRGTADAAFVGAALHWHTFLLERIGFQRAGDELAINYFAARDSGRVPNNSTDVLRYLAELSDVTGDDLYLVPRTGLLTFLRHVQKPSGEFPYAVGTSDPHERRPHFQCYQYNAFQCLGLMRYYELTRDPAALPIITGVLRFLRTGVAADGHALYECGNRYRAVTYHAAVLGAAFARAGQLGIDGYEDLSHRAFSYVLRMRRGDGNYKYSTGDYRVLSDRRSYPRYLAMILHHLLLRVSASETRGGYGVPASTQRDQHEGEQGRRCAS